MYGSERIKNKRDGEDNNRKILLRMENIGKSFSGVKVLDDVSFDLKSGEVHILAGENGAGKTTLIKIIAGVHTDYEGEIWLEGQTVKFKSPHDAARKGISTIHQEMSLINSMSVEDNMFLGREKTHAGLWVDYHTQRNQVRSLLEQMEVDVAVSTLIEQCPLSVRQMIEIAKALVNEARIIIMDEPTSTLSDSEVSRLFEIIKNLKNKGCGIIYISHRLEEIYRIGDRVSILRDGRYIGTSTPQKLPPEDLIQWMVGRRISKHFPERSPLIGKECLKVENFFLPDPAGSKSWAVEDFSLCAHSGEIVGVAGLQGSGKSEFFNGLFGTYGRAAKGNIFLDGKPFNIQSPGDSINHGLALLTNERKNTGLIPFMSITRNVSLASLNKHSKWGWIRSQSEESAAAGHAKKLRIKARSLDQEIDTLSGGNQQKVVLAKWLETQPRVLLLNEPTMGVDVGAKHDIYALMNKWTAQGLAILLITSELSELLAMSDRIIVMHRGRRTAEYSGNEATQEKITRASMGETEI